MTITFDSSLLLSYYQAKAGLPVTGSTGSTSSTATKQVAPTAPWTGTQDAKAASAAVTAAMAGHKLIDENAAKLDLPGASADYKKMFALYQGLTTLSGIAEQMNNKGLTSIDKQRIQEVFAAGMQEVAGYVDSAQLDQFRLAEGAVSTQARSTLGVPKASNQSTYSTAPLMTGSAVGPVPAFQGDVQFNIAIKRINTTTNVAIDLSEMGSQTRDLPNVINFINQKLADAGVYTRVASQRIPGEERTTTVGGQTVTLAPSPDQWAMQFKIDSSETLTFSAPTTAPAVYVAQASGDPNPDKDPTTNDSDVVNQLLKFQTDTSQVPAPAQTPGEANWVDGRLFSTDLDPAVQTVRATQTGPDGSVYMLADVNGKVDDQGIKGATDVALLKYDSAGNLVYTRTLGASQDASGLALAVSADGKVAIAGSVTGGLGGSTDGALNSTGAFAGMSDSFVTVFDAQGQEMWTQRRGARQDDAATSVAFGADGTVYVAGKAKSTMPAGDAIGDWDNYIEAFKADAKGVVKPVFTQQFGTTGADIPAGMVVDGNFMTTASVENGHAILRRFDISSGTPSLVATRDIGDLKGGNIAGIALNGGNIVVAGTSGDGNLNVGTVTRAYSGGADAFAATFSADLSAGAGDSVAYYGGAGDDKATALSVSNGQVFIAGSAGTDLPGQDPVGKKDGFLAQIDPSTGAVDWSRRFTGKDGMAAPTSIAVDGSGSSVLDTLGLPKGTLNLSDSQQLTALSSLRAGDQFTVKVGDGVAKTVTIDADETMSTLVTKLNRAMGFQGKVSVATVSGMQYLQIQPLNDRTVIEIGAGKGDKDALAQLGLPEGVVRATTTDKNGKTTSADGKGQFYGLGLDSDLNLSTQDQVNHALAQLAAAQGVIRTAYQDLVAAASPQTAATTSGKTGGTVPAYLTAQIANYQAALDRLTGGSSG